VYFHLKGGFGLDFAAYEEEIMKEVALTSSSLCDAYRKF